jgi:hypothetical protein
MVSPRDILDKLLNTEVTGVTAHEMIGVSHDLSTVLADLIRVRNMTSANANAQAHHVQGHFRLPLSGSHWVYLLLPKDEANGFQYYGSSQGEKMVSHIIWNAIFRSNYEIPEIALSGRVALWVHFLYPFCTHLVHFYYTLVHFLVHCVIDFLVHFLVQFSHTMSYQWERILPLMEHYE